MDFIFSPALWFLPFSFVPLIFHIINNKKFKTIEFGAIRFIEVLKAESIRNINLINILLLLIRMLIILFLILAVSRPVVNSSLKSYLYDDSSTIIAILIDDTYSNFNKEIHREQTIRFDNVISSVLEEYSPKTSLKIASINNGLIYSGITENFALQEVVLD